MKITYLGHASLAIDYILITHAHFDHVADVELIAKRTNAILISNYEIVMHYKEKGLKGHPMNHGGSWQFDFGKVTYTNAIHTSSFADGTYGGHPGGFILETTEGTVYIAGDTALTYDMKLIPLKAKLDLAILPIGDNFTMGMEDAVLASDFVECNKVLGYHFDTFGYIKIDHQKAKDAFAVKNKELILLDIGAFMNV